MKKRHRALAIAAWALLGLSTVSVARSADAACDRQFLKEFVDQYIAAMIAHDARKAPLARDIVIVENLKRIGTDAGLWASTSAAPNAFRIYVPDTVQQQIGYIGFMQADGKPVEFALRLKVAQGRIVEAEHLVAYSLRENVLAHFEKPRAAFLQSVSDEYRDSRGRLLKIAADYYDALDENNGALAPFADDCVRFENGMQTVRNVVPADPAASPFGILGSLGCEPRRPPNFLHLRPLPRT